MKLVNSVKLLKILLVFFLSAIPTVVSECNIEQGCLMRKKFLTYVTYQNKHGDPVPSKTTLNHKILYVFLDKLVIYSSSKAADARIEPEVPSSKREDEDKIERIINFGEIILDCGKTHNKLCHISEYNGLMEKPIFQEIKKGITNTPDIKCLVIPFFENGYKQVHEKMAFTCINDVSQINDLLQFKNSLSRLIENFQAYMSRDRYSSFNGLLRKQGKFITYISNKQNAVIARLYGKEINMVSNDEKATYLSSFSLFQLRNTNAFFVKTLIKKGVLKEDWNSQFDTKPTDDCCLGFPGETETLYLCASDQTGKNLETSTDICLVKLKEFLKQTRIILHGIKLAENFYQLTTNKKKLLDCKTKEYNIFYDRIQNAINYAIFKDCIINEEYGRDTEDNKYAYCFKHFGDEIKLEVKLLAFNHDGLFNALSDCVYKFKFTDKLTEAYLKKQLKSRSTKQPQSFLQVQETDDYDDDDSPARLSHDGPTTENHNDNIVTEEHHTQDELHFGILTDDSVLNNEKSEAGLDPNLDELNVMENTKPGEGADFNFMQVKEAKAEKKKKKKNIMDLAYTKPKKRNNEEMNTVNIYRQNKMNDLQKNHQWHHSLREGIDMKFNKLAASGGKKNADNFVSFLGYLRDASHKASFNINALEIEKYFKQ